MTFHSTLGKSMRAVALVSSLAVSASAQTAERTPPKESIPQKSKPQQSEMSLAIPLTKDDGVYYTGDGWKGFLSERFHYNAAHRLTLQSMVDVARESEEERGDVPSERLAKRVRKVVQGAATQTLVEELRNRMTLDNWLEDRLIEPAQEFTEEYLLEPVVRVVTSPLRILSRKQLYEHGMLTRLDFLQDALSGRQERNQLINPLNNEGIPGEERYQPSRLPEKIALGVRPFRSSPYGYGTIRLGEWYAHGRLSAADVFDSPRLNEASLLFQTKLDIHDIVLSFGTIKPFKNNHDRQEAERYFGMHGFLGLSKIVSNGNGAYGEAYVETRVGREQGFFIGLNWQY